MKVWPVALSKAARSSPAAASNRFRSSAGPLSASRKFVDIVSPGPGFPGLMRLNAVRGGAGYRPAPELGRLRATGERPARGHAEGDAALQASERIAVGVEVADSGPGFPDRRGALAGRDAEGLAC